MNRVTLARLIETLEHEDVLERDDGGSRHRLGMGFLVLASRALASRDLPRLATPVLRRLAGRLNLTAYLAVPDGGAVVYLLRETPDAPLVSNVRIGSRIPAHLTAPGRVLLAGKPEAELRALLGPEPLAAATEQSPTTYAGLLCDLERVRGEGCAWSFSAFEAGVNACAAPVRDGSGAAVAAIGLAGPQAQFSAGRAGLLGIEAALKRAVGDLSVLNGWDGGTSGPAGQGT